MIMSVSGFCFPLLPPEPWHKLPPRFPLQSFLTLGKPHEVQGLGVCVCVWLSAGQRAPPSLPIERIGAKGPPSEQLLTIEGPEGKSVCVCMCVNHLLPTNES